MEPLAITTIGRIQALTARVVATQPAGHQLCLIGGYRYRLLDASPRASIDIDYHWEGDLDEKQAEIVDVLRKRVRREVKRQFDLDGDVRPAGGPAAESPAVRIVDMAFYRTAEPGSRIEIPLEITRISRLDSAAVRTVAGTVFLTVSDADMIESKIIALLNRQFTQARDIVDIFLFQDSLPLDAARRLSQKLSALALPPADVIARIDRLRAARNVHVKEIERILDAQVEPAVAANLRVAGGATMIWDRVMRQLTHTLTTRESNA